MQERIKEIAPAVGRSLVVKILVSLLTSIMRSIGRVASAFCDSIAPLRTIDSLYKRIVPV